MTVVRACDLAEAAQALCFMKMGPREPTINRFHPGKLALTTERQPFEDVSSIKNGGFSIVRLVFGEVKTGVVSPLSVE